jgi:hypothetical protein
MREKSRGYTRNPGMNCFDWKLRNALGEVQEIGKGREEECTNRDKEGAREEGSQRNGNIRKGSARQNIRSQSQTEQGLLSVPFLHDTPYLCVTFACRF